ncbi:2-phosphosulfolactate phosphatase [Aestuariimicrobium ganziense]|uniref:2-phosphosulfolactate phosphatase n=1 Tax=Aestuariimicrobium ganziense TaxID=2773677 RepID=UPI00194132EF|nr:2-phosphosulfolactate phosphatase [Aestuariimicrobium ganziense]
MTIRTVHVNELEPRDVAWCEVAVVIDVVRAFTVAPWILRMGAAQLLLAPDVETAMAARDAHHPHALLLKDGPAHPLFDLPNSPAIVSGTDLTGRTLIQTTGNGTRGAHAVREAALVLCASFANASATAHALCGDGQRVLLVPTEGDEDVALADFLTEALTTTNTSDPVPYLVRVRNSEAGRECLACGADESCPSVHRDDLALCLQVDAFDQALSLVPAGSLLRVVPVGSPVRP